jgi:glyoxylase-like metal-dependent hydrolase (beta-lactamase superfamily II)
MQVVQGIHRIETDYPDLAGIPLYLYLILDEEIALVDTGVPGMLAGVVEPYLASIGLKPSDITMIIHTHGHPDHFGGNYEVKEASGAQILAPLADAPWVEDHELHWRELWEGFPGDLTFDEATRDAIMNVYCGPDTKVDEVFRNGDMIKLGREHTLEVIPTPGHSPGHVSFYDAKYKAVLTGDTVQGWGIPMVAQDAVVGPLYTELDPYVEGLERLLDLDMDYLLGAHCPVLRGEEAKELVRESIRYTEGAQEFIEKMLTEASEPLSIAEIAEALGTQLISAGGVSLQSVGVTTAHLRKMLGEKRVQGLWRLPGPSRPQIV